MGFFGGDEPRQVVDTSRLRGEPTPESTGPAPSVFRAQYSQEEETEKFAGPAGEQLTRKARTSPFMGANQAISYRKQSKQRETNIFKHPLKYFSTASPLDFPRDTFNFFFENEMAAFGMKWEGTTFPTISMDHFKKSWSEEPLWTSVGLGSMALMAIPPLYGSFKVGTLGKKLGKGFRVAPEMTEALKRGDEYVAQGAEGYRRLDTALEMPAVQKELGARTGIVSELSNASEIPFYHQQFAGAATDGLRKYAEADWLSQFWMVDDVAEWAKRFGPDDLKTSLKGMDQADARKVVRELDDSTKDLIFSQIPEGTIKKARQQAYSQNNYQILQGRKMLSEMEGSGVKLSQVEKLKLKFHESFANTHAASTLAFDPLVENAQRGEIMTDIARNMERWNDPKTYGAILDNLPGAEAVDPNWMRHLVHRYGEDVATAMRAQGDTNWINKVAKPKGSLPVQQQALLDNTVEFLVKRQKAMAADGFIDPRTAEEIPWHFFSGKPATAAKAAEKAALGQGNIRAQQTLARVVDAETGKVRHTIGMSVIPDLSSPTLRQRIGGRDPLEIAKRLDEGKLIDNPQDLLLHSVIADGNLWEAHKLTRDMLMKDEYATPFADLAEKFEKSEALKKGYVNLNEVLSNPEKDRLVRMIKGTDENAARRLLGPGDELPFLKTEWYNDVFGKMGVIEQGAHSANFMDAVTTAYKTMKTALNPTTQVTNVFGNYAFLYQAGMNPLSPDNIKFQARIAKQSHKLAKLQSKHNIDNLSLENWSKVKLTDDSGRVLSVEEISPQLLKGSEVLKDEYVQKIVPYLNELKKIDAEGGWSIGHKSLQGENSLNFLALMGDEVAIAGGMVDPKWAAMKEFVVTEARGDVEMWGHMTSMYSKLVKEAGRGNDQIVTRKFVEGMLKLHDPTMEKRVIKKVRARALRDPISGQVIREGELKPVEEMVRGAADTLGKKAYKGTVTNSFENMTRLYVSGDVIPKLALFAHNMDEGMGMMGSIREVARRTPMYKHVGSKLKGARRWFLPWVTFPAEAARITKNNLMDNPLRMLPWLKAPQMMQYAAMEMGMLPEGMTRESLVQAMAGSPDWIQEGGSAAQGGQGQAVMFGGERGMRGTAVAGGASIGGIGMAAAYALGMGGSPTTAAVKALGAAAAGGVLGGWMASTSHEAENPDHLRTTILNWLPHTAALPKGFVPGAGAEALNPMEASPVEAFSILKPMLNVLQGKNQYGEDIQATGNVDYMSNVFASYVGMLSPPVIQKYGFKVTTPDTAGYMQELWEPGVSAALGAFYGLAAGGVGGAVAGGVAGAVAGGAAKGVVPGLDIVNTSRMYVDAGKVKNPYTHEYGVSSHDLFINNLGSFKSYRVTPETDLFNQKQEAEEYRQVRSYHTKNLRWALENTQEPGDQADLQARSLIKDVYSTFYEEYPDDPVTRMKKFENWMKPQMGSLGKAAALRGASASDIDMMMRRFSENAQVTGKQLEFWRGQLIQTLKKEQMARAQKSIGQIYKAQSGRKAGRPPVSPFGGSRLR